MFIFENTVNQIRRYTTIRWHVFQILKLVNCSCVLVFSEWLFWNKYRTDFDHFGKMFWLLVCLEEHIWTTENVVHINVILKTDVFWSVMTLLAQKSNKSNCPIISQKANIWSSTHYAVKGASELRQVGTELDTQTGSHVIGLQPF